MEMLVFALYFATAYSFRYLFCIMVLITVSVLSAGIRLINWVIFSIKIIKIKPSFVSFMYFYMRNILMSIIFLCIKKVFSLWDIVRALNAEARWQLGSDLNTYVTLNKSVLSRTYHFSNLTFSLDGVII